MGLKSRLFGRGVGDVKMSVVIAVYNTGKYIEPCIESLLAQSLPSNEYELIFVDDGSTDATPERLDRLAAEHDNVTTIHIPNSGWPGKPRNVGIDAARGEYVYFVDHDDSLAPEALERMYNLASANDADVIIGKIAGHGRRVPRTLFRRNFESCTIETAPLLESMTPHKGFRREFLNQHSIRFPEGRRRLEDHVFVVEAYLRAASVSVLSDYTCYHHIARDDAGNAGFASIEPVGYYGNLREAIDIVERLTEPGDLRDLVLRRWYAVEMLRRVTGKVFLGFSGSARKAMYKEIRRLALERFTSPGIWKDLAPHLRVASELLRSGRFDDLVGLAEYQSSLEMICEIERFGWQEDGLLLTAVMTPHTPTGGPVLRVEDGEALYQGPATGVPDEVRTVRRKEPVTAELQLRLRGATSRHVMPMTVEIVQDGGVERYRVSAAFDPSSVRGAPLAPGVWDPFIRLREWGAGADFTRRVGAERATGFDAALVPGVVGAGPTTVVPYWTEKDNLSLDVGEHTRSLTAALQGRGRNAESELGPGGLAVRVTVPLHTQNESGEVPIRLVSAMDGGVEISAPARVAAVEGGAVLSATLPAEAAGGDLAIVPGGASSANTPLGLGLPQPPAKEPTDRES
jgi:poly(ribitol-phosphate) beta-N-acetylglucosaminyltransferase